MTEKTAVLLERIGPIDTIPLFAASDETHLSARARATATYPSSVGASPSDLLSCIPLASGASEVPWGGAGRWLRWALGVRGFYEYVFYHRLACQAPTRIADLTEGTAGGVAQACD